MPILLNKKWGNVKPPVGSQINWGHPLSKGLVGCWLMNEGGGRILKDLVGLHTATLNSARWKPGKYISPDFTSSNYATILNNKMGNKELTVVASVKFDSISATANIIDNLWGNDAAGGFQLLILGNSTFNYSVGVTGGRLAVASTFNVVANVDYFTALTGSPGSQEIYINGILNNTAIGLGTPIISTQNTTIGANSAADTAFMNGKIYYIYIWYRVLSPSEISSLYTSPYQFIQSPRRYYIFPTAIAAGININQIERTTPRGVLRGVLRGTR